MGKVGIIGLGVVGQAMRSLFPLAMAYDKYKMYSGVRNREAINEECELAIVCVPTPMGKDGRCDTSTVEEVLSWVRTPLVLIKSTVPPGFTAMMNARYGRTNICFSPEFCGESAYYIPSDMMDPVDIRTHPYMIVGGYAGYTSRVVDIFMRVLGPTKTYFQCGPTEAEIIKYMENTFFAMKVTFCNWFYDMCQGLDVDYNVVREGWTLDPRVGKMHTAVLPDKRGFGGKCLPKDVNAIRKVGERVGLDTTLLDAVLHTNEKMKS